MYSPGVSVDMKYLAAIFLGVVGCAAPLPCGEGEASLDLDGDPEALYRGDVLPQFSLTIGEAAMADLPISQQDDSPEVHADFAFRGEISDVGLSLKGHSSFRPISEKAAFKIDFAEWDDAGSLHGIRRLTLNNMVSDQSKLAEELGYALYELAGLPAARHGFACLEVNGEDYGLYGVVETMDEQFVARAFQDPSGTLYEANAQADFFPGGI